MTDRCGDDQSQKSQDHRSATYLNPRPASTHGIDTRSAESISCRRTGPMATHVPRPAGSRQRGSPRWPGAGDGHGHGHGHRQFVVGPRWSERFRGQRPRRREQQSRQVLPPQWPLPCSDPRSSQWRQQANRKMVQWKRMRIPVTRPIGMLVRGRRQVRADLPVLDLLFSIRGRATRRIGVSHVPPCSGCLTQARAECP